MEAGKVLQEVKVLCADKKYEEAKRMAVEEEKGKVNVLICNTNNEGGEEKFCEEAFL